MIKVTILIPDGYTRLDGVVEIYDPVHANRPEQLPYQYLSLDCDLSPRKEIKHVLSLEHSGESSSDLNGFAGFPHRCFVVNDIDHD